MEQKKRAWVYCRIDAPEDTHGAIKEQRKLLMDYAEQMGFTVVGSSEDLSSGLDYERPGLKRFAKAVETNRADVLVIHDISRIGRDTCQTMNYLEQLRQKGVAVYSPLEGILDFSFQRVIRNIAEHADPRMRL